MKRRGIKVITINTLWYTLLWVGMMVLGGLMYEQPHFVRKRATKYKTLELAGWVIIITAMLGLIHYGILVPLGWVLT